MIFSYTSCCVLGKKYCALDACTNDPHSHFDDRKPGNYDGQRGIARIVCCEMDGSSCTRHTGSEKMCSARVTWNYANRVCQKMGKRLCNGQNELNKCCGTGCNFDVFLAWVNADC